MTEYGTGIHRVVGQQGTCFSPRYPDREDTILCDRDRGHPGRHAAWDANDKRRYWKTPAE